MSTKYQTLSGFMLSPFHGKEDVQKDTDYDSKYRSFVTSNKIKLFAMCEVEDSFYLHLKVPSESQKDGKYEYDVVIRFFTDKPDTLKQPDLTGYYVQFFSNSPSFMYQFAYIYNQEGYLIESLYNKLDAEYIDVPPEKTNATMKKSYDKSIYFACRFLQEHKFKMLAKRGILLSKKVDQRKFFNNISDFKSVKLDQSILSEERKLKKILDDRSPRNRKQTNTSNSQSYTNKKTATKNTSLDNKSSITIIKKKTGGTKVTAKKVAKKSTR